MSSLFRISNIAILVLSLMLTACGGGGGGGGGGSNGDTTQDVGDDRGAGDGGSDDGGSTPTEVRQFNTYMPLANMSDVESISFFDSKLDQSYNVTQYRNDAKSTAAGLDIYTIDYGTELELSLHVSSTPDSVQLHELEIPIAVTPLITAERLKFDTPLVIFDPAASSGSQQLTGKAFTNLGVGVDVDIDADRRSAPALLESDFGPQLPMTNNIIRMTISLTFLGVPYQFEVTTNIALAQGLGVVRITGDLSGTTAFDSKIESLNNLPEPVWFLANMGEPILDTGYSLSQEISTDFGPLSTNDYSIANQQELDAISWIEVNTTTSDTYIVELNNNGLPTEADPDRGRTSVEVVLEHKVTGERRSVNVTLQPDPLVNLLNTI